MTRIFSFTLSLLGVILVLVVGIFLGGHPDLLPGSVRGALVDEAPGARARDELFQEIHDNYYKSVDLQKLESDSLTAIVRGLHDRFSNYLDPKQAALFEERVRGGGEFEGVGLSVQQDPKGLLVADVFRGSPAERAGIRMGDVISRVNGDSLAGEPTESATAKIKGRPNTTVKLTVIDPSSTKSRSLTVKRARIEIPVAVGRLRRIDGVPLGVVRLTSFTSGSHAAVRGEVERVLRQGAKGIVLDLRGNGGGLLDEAVLVSSIFVEDGLIVSTDGRTKPRRELNADGDAIDGKIPVVVLVDGGSASASEIVTGALRDRHRATIVGTRTFGKGVFQEVETLSNGGALSLTVGEYFLPSGENISHKGITPSVKARDLPRTRRDEALPKALQTLRSKVG